MVPAFSMDSSEALVGSERLFFCQVKSPMADSWSAPSEGMIS
jgi:hypothetical protein